RCCRQPRTAGGRWGPMSGRPQRPSSGLESEATAHVEDVSILAMSDVRGESAAVVEVREPDSAAIARVPGVRLLARVPDSPDVEEPVHAEVSREDQREPAEPQP